MTLALSLQGLLAVTTIARCEAPDRELSTDLPYCRILRPGWLTIQKTGDCSNPAWGQ